ncbi:uncharacterized protein LOC122079444 [Macadamia integrifolia]|uniref:uncharacterized protein LOC122079444 n=1 Tax=Macadamia integrifolia TaxID=60698 RepID=UPI001C4FC1D0|nr:uncharacterized protein LOC122079444 [Macadamia integrifolia]
MAFLEGGESFSESIYNELSLEDVDMDDVEEGGRGRKREKKKKKKKGGISTSSIADINRFVIDMCRYLKEKKSYLVWNAVGCLGVGALSDLVKEVEAIQACGGQMTADGKRLRTGGGILWCILKTREPKAYKEIMMKGKEFEKQFRQQRVTQVSEQNKEDPAQKIACASSYGIINQVSKEFAAFTTNGD